MGEQSQRIARLAASHVGGAARTLGYLLITGLHRETPVDTTNARGNWTASAGEATTQKYGHKEYPTLIGFIRGQQEIAHYKLNDGILWIVNNVHYIVDLNQGSSPQAPAGYVPRLIGKVVRRVQAMYGRFRA